MSFQTARLGKTILEINGLTFGYEKALLENFTYFFQKNDRMELLVLMVVVSLLYQGCSW